jgi:hypothetical protein
MLVRAESSFVSSYSRRRRLNQDRVFTMAIGTLPVFCRELAVPCVAPGGRTSFAAASASSTYWGWQLAEADLVGRYFKDADHSFHPHSPSAPRREAPGFAARRTTLRFLLLEELQQFVCDIRIKDMLEIVTSGNRWNVNS